MGGIGVGYSSCDIRGNYDEGIYKACNDYLMHTLPFATEMTIKNDLYICCSEFNVMQCEKG